MQKLGDKHRYSVVDRCLRFTSIRFRSRPEAAPYAEGLKKHRATLRAKSDAYLDAYEERVATGYEIAYLDSRLDRAVIVDLKRDVAALLGKLANGEQLEKKLFQGVAPSAGMAPVADEAQSGYVAGITSRLETDPDFAPVASHAKKLRKLQKSIDEALTRRKDQRVTERLAYGDLDEALEEARREYNQLHARMTLAFPNAGALVESFVVALKKRGGTESEGGAEDGTPDAPVDGTPDEG